MAIRYLVPDGKHLPVTGEDGKADHHLMGAAWAALHGGYRGNKYEGPDKEKAIAALKRMYEEEKMALPSQQSAVGSRQSADGQQMHRAQMGCRVLQEVSGFDGATWDVEITKVGVCDGTPPLDWPAEVLERDKQVFQNVACYVDHLTEKDVREGRGHSVTALLGHIENPRMGDGALIGTLHLLDPVEWAPKIRALQKLPPGIAGMSTDVRFFPAKDRGAGGRQKVGEIVRHPSNSLDLVSPPGGGGRILRAVQSAAGEEWEAVNLAAEHDPTAARPNGGNKMKEKIQKVLQAIRGLDAARAGTVETEIAAMDEEKQFERVTQVQTELLTADRVQQKACHQCHASVDAKQKFCHQCGAKQKFSDDDSTAKQAQQSAISDADRETLKQASETAKQLRVTQAALRLGQKLTESRLPKPLRDKIAKQFAELEFTDEQLDAEIKEVRQAYAALMPQNRISAESIEIGLQPEDKLQIAMDKLWGVTHEVKQSYDARGFLRVAQGAPHPATDVPGFRGIREAYIAFTGDSDVSGDPSKIRRVTQMESLAAFPLALANTLNRLLVREYAQVDYHWREITSQVTAPMDFRTQERVRVGYLGDLSGPLPEDTPYTETTSITDEQATYNVGTFGNLLTITRRAIINDDIGVMKRNVALLGRAAARTLARQIWNQLINNVAYGPDSLNIFSNTHGNVGTAAMDSVVDSITALNAILTAFFTMTEKDSGERLGLRPKFLAVPIQVLPEALMLNNSQFTVDGNNVRSDNPWYQYFGATDGSGRPAGILTNPLFTDATDWYAFADPDEVDTLEVGFLQGRQAPEFFLADNPLVGSMFTQDRIVYKVRFEFGSTVLDYRGMYKEVVAG